MLDAFTDYTHIFTDGSKDGGNTAALIVCPSFEFSIHLPVMSSIFTAKLEVIVSALRYIQSTTKSNKSVIFSYYTSTLQALLSKWDHPTVQTIMRFLVFIDILSVYSPFADMVGLPLHNTPFSGVLMKSIGAAFFDRMPFLTSTRTVIFCWLSSHMGISGNERADSIAEAALHKDVSECLISYSDAYQYITNTYAIYERVNGRRLLTTSFMLQNP